MPKVEYQYLLTCPECGGVISMYSERMLTKAQVLEIEAKLPATCILCMMIKDVGMKGKN